MQMLLVLLLIITLPILTRSEPAGWAKYFEENPDEFHDLPLKWERNASDIPAWLGGTFVRNGPAQLNFGTNKHHLGSWLDGYAKLHSFKFNGKSQVLFSGKMLQSRTYLDNMAAGEIVPQITLTSFMNDTDEWSWKELIQLTWKMYNRKAFDNTNPGLWRMGSAAKPMYVATTDQPVLTQFNISNLDTVALLRAKNAVGACTHWMREPGTDNSINFMVKIGWRGPYVEVQRYKSDNHKYDVPEVIGTFVADHMSMVHSFSITENHLIFFFYPLYMSASDLLSVNFHVMEAVEWHENQMTDVYVVHLKTGDVQKISTKTLFSYHHINAYETKNGTEIILDMSPSDPFGLKDYTLLKNMLHPPEKSTGINGSTCGPNEVTRYKINLKTKQVESSTFLNSLPNDYMSRFDFPTINEAYRGKEYCITYGLSAFNYYRTALVKKNVCDSTQDKVWHTEHHYASEMYFITNPEGTKEDDGVLVTIVFDGNREQSYLLLLDAQTFTPLDAAFLPHNIPWSAHGIHFPEAQF